tara:strand:+ start:44 stop:1204 length:1161 start_codon:yes stop_codon:yes gene_type:complete
MTKKKITMGEAEKELIKFLGEDTVFLNGDVSIGKYEAVSTGSPLLDHAIGIGGIPRGRITQLAGKESSGKTMLALSCIKSFLDANPSNTALFIDAEFTYDPKWAASLGVDTSRVMVLKTNDAKKIFEGLLGISSVNSRTGKVTKKVKGILDYVTEGESDRFKNLGIVVLDSIAALNTPMESVAEIGKANMAPVPRFLSTELKKLTPVVADSNVAFIGINQVRVNLGQMYGDPTSSPGGKALKHACSLMINMAPISGADSYIMSDSGDRIGHKVRAKIGKNKVGRPFMKCEYSIKYTEGVVNIDEEILELAILFGHIERPNNRTYTHKENKFVGKAAVLEHLRENKDMTLNMLEEIRDSYINGETSIGANTNETIDNPVIEELVNMV